MCLENTTISAAIRRQICHHCLNMESISDYEAMARKAINVFSNSFTVDKYDIEVTINMGICLFDENNSDAESIIKHAEIALFWAKNEGKNKYKFYSSDIDVQTYKQFELYADMLKAIDNDQFRVYYQPIMDLKTNRVIAAEGSYQMGSSNLGYGIADGIHTHCRRNWLYYEYWKMGV